MVVSRNLPGNDGSREHRPAGNAHLIAAELSATRCRWCNDDLEHCHESLIVHEIGDAHCMAADCATPRELHHMIVSCTEFGCGCASSAQRPAATASGAA